MRTVACLAVRMGSERLPGKTLQQFSGRPLLYHLIQRVLSAKTVDEVVVATTLAKEDNQIENYCQQRGWLCSRGPQENVLTRIKTALADRGAKVGVVVYGDNPLVDPVIIDEVVVTFHREKRYDWIGNNLVTTFPAGMEVEAFRIDSIIKADAAEVSKEIREHGTLYIRQNPDEFKLLNIEAEGVRRRPELCLGIDTHQDAVVVGKIIEHFSGSSRFSLEDIIEYVDSTPGLAGQNQHIHRRWRQYRRD